MRPMEEVAKLSGCCLPGEARTLSYLTLMENAQVLAEYVDAVRRNTGAERVDLVGHSLGGLISRYYIQNLMPEVTADGLPPVPAVNQFVIAGTPNGGTACGRPGAALRLFSPATSQITPEYLTQVYNVAVRDRRGVPFFALAGDAVRESAIRCSAALQAPAPPQAVRATALVRLEEGAAEPIQVPLEQAGDGAFAATFTPDRAGDWTVTIALTGRDASGAAFERLSVLGFTVQAY